MANHSLPTVESGYLDFIAQVTGRLVDVALAFDPAYTDPTNTPTNAVRLNSAAGRWERWSGTEWIAAVTTWAANISGKAATAGAADTAAALATPRAINGVDFDGTEDVSISARSPSAVTFASSDGAADGSEYDGGSALKVSYATVGAPSTDGEGASGTWDIDISGQAETALNLEASAELPDGVTGVTKELWDRSKALATTEFVRPAALLNPSNFGMSDAGRLVVLSSNATLFNGVYPAGLEFTVYNNSDSSITLSGPPGGGAQNMIRIAGTSTTSQTRTLAPRTLARLIAGGNASTGFVGFLISGVGVS